MPQPGMKLDLGGIAKEFAVHEAAKAASAQGLLAGIIDAGGDICTIGAKSDQEAWRIGIQHPRQQNALLASVSLRNWDTVETSGGESSSDDSMGKGRIAISIKDHKIVSINYVGVDSEGKLKGADYGKTNGKIESPAFYQKAQTAVKANTAYAEQLLQVQELDKVDAISGATISYQQFIEAAKMALLEAKK